MTLGFNSRLNNYDNQSFIFLSQFMCQMFCSVFMSIVIPSECVISLLYKLLPRELLAISLLKAVVISLLLNLVTYRCSRVLVWSSRCIFISTVFIGV